jgi:hypothetical protein
MKKVFMLLAVFWLAALGWSKTTNPTTTNDSATTDLEFIQDWSPPPPLVNYNNYNETPLTAVAVVEEVAPPENSRNFFSYDNDNAKQTCEETTRLTAVAAVKSVMNSILPSPNWGESFNANETANYANVNEEKRYQLLLFQDLA